MKGPWWALPGVAAIVGTLTIVSAAQGSLTAAKVTLPREVQVVASGAHHPVQSSPPTTEPAGEQVVTPSHPVISEPGTTASGTRVSAGSGDGSSATVVTGPSSEVPAASAPGTPSIDPGGDPSTPIGVTSDPAVTPTTTGGPPASSTTTSSSTTTTTHPGERGDH